MKGGQRASIQVEYKSHEGGEVLLRGPKVQSEAEGEGNPIATMCQSLTCSLHCLSRPELRFLEDLKLSWELRSEHHHPPPYLSTPLDPSPHPAR